MEREHFLAATVQERGWTAGAELGLWYGRTFGYLLERCPRLTLVGVDIFRDIGVPDYRDGAWDHAGNLRQVRAIADRFPQRAILIQALTVDAAKLVQPASLDFVFIDADHRTDAVVADIRAWAPSIRPGGWLMGHDVDWPSVKAALQSLAVPYQVGPDNVWFAEGGFHG